MFQVTGTARPFRMSNMKIEAMVHYTAQRVRRERLDELRGVLHEIETGPSAPPQVLARVTAYLNLRAAELEAEGV